MEKPNARSLEYELSIARVKVIFAACNFVDTDDDKDFEALKKAVQEYRLANANAEFGEQIV